MKKMVKLKFFIICLNNSQSKNSTLPKQKHYFYVTYQTAEGKYF